MHLNRVNMLEVETKRIYVVLVLNFFDDRVGILSVYDYLFIYIILGDSYS